MTFSIILMILLWSFCHISAAAICLLSSPPANWSLFSGIRVADVETRLGLLLFLVEFSECGGASSRRARWHAKLTITCSTVGLTGSGTTNQPSFRRRPTLKSKQPKTMLLLRLDSSIFMMMAQEDPSYVIICFLFVFYPGEISSAKINTRSTSFTT